MTLAATIRTQDYDRYLAAAFVPASKRETYFLLCAFNTELARARAVASQPMLALIRLHWWREVVEGVERHHEIARPLYQALEQGQLHRDTLLHMIAAREIEADDEVADGETFRALASGTAGLFAEATGRLCDAPDATWPRLRNLGTAYGIAAQIGNLQALAAAQRCLLPADLLAQHGLQREDVIADPRCAQPVVRVLAGQALSLIKANGGWLPATAIAAAVPSVLARRDLRRLQRQRLLADTLAVLAAGMLRRI